MSATAGAGLQDILPRFGKPELVSQLLAAKEASGKTFTQIGQEIGRTNLYTTQLFFNQAQLKPGAVELLQKAVPALTEAQLAAMQRCPMRSYDPSIVQEPHVYRTQEAVLHYGEAIKAVMNEELGDGIMSAIDMFATLDVIEGKQGEKRVCISLNGKFLPHTEQIVENNTAPRP
jgi:cyanate lyase